MNLSGTVSIQGKAMAPAAASRGTTRDVVSHPGVLVKAAMDKLGFSINAFARELKVSPPTIHRIVTGKSAISPEMALRLSITVGNSPKDWLLCQAEYDLYKTKKEVDLSDLAKLKPQCPVVAPQKGAVPTLAVAPGKDITLEGQVESVFEGQGLASHTRDTYSRQAKHFVKWCQEKHGCKTLAQCWDYANAWLASRGHLSCFTQELDATVLAKLYGCSRKAFIPTDGRCRDKIKRSRGERVRDRFFSEEKHRDFVAFCRGTGLKRAELRALTGDQLRIEAEGIYIDMPPSGHRPVRRVPVIGDVGLVIRMMQAAGSGKVFPRVYTGADIQSYRGDYARALYRMHARDLETCRQTPFTEEKCNSDLTCRNCVHVLKGGNEGAWLDRQAMKVVTDALGLRHLKSFSESYL